jgi:biopolymer transport protein ExbB
MSNALGTSNIYSLVQLGGPVMWPLLGLSVMTIATALERAGFWMRLISKEDRIVHDVLDAAHHSLDDAAKIAYQARNLAIGRFLFATLRLSDSSPETFHLAMEAAAEREFIQMRKGDKLLETVVGIAPLLGLLGTVTGLMATFSSLNLGGGSGANAGLSKAAAGIGEALITTAAGMFVAILALIFFRIFVTLQAMQMDYFNTVGNQLELIYRHVWCEDRDYRSTQATSGIQPAEAKPDPEPSTVSGFHVPSSSYLATRKRGMSLSDKY